MAEETIETDSQPAYIADELTDDYERWDCELPETLHRDKTILYVPDPWDFLVGWVSRPTQEVPN